MDKNSNDLTPTNPQDITLIELEDITTPWNWGEFFDGVAIGIAIGAVLCGGM